MSNKTGIGWCDSTANMVIGCTKVSPGCTGCYAMNDTPARVLRHRGIETWGPKGTRVEVKSFEKNMLAMNRKPWICDLCGSASPANRRDNGSCLNSECAYHTKSAHGSFHRRRVFADSNSDWLDKKWPIERFARFMEVIRRAENVSILLLTKRPENFRERFDELGAWRLEQSQGPDQWTWEAQWRNGHRPPAHIWIGVSVEDQKRTDRISELIDIPAAIRFISVEPLLEKTELLLTCIAEHSPNRERCVSLIGSEIGWVIVGAESGPNRRDCGVDALEDIARQCQAAKVPCFVKQDCALRPGQQGRISPEIWAMKQFPI